MHGFLPSWNSAGFWPKRRPRPAASPLARRAAARALRLWREEDGSITIFVLVMFLLMLAVAGMAIDVMRHESNRALVQSTLDRSVLASASLDQTTDAAGARAIVEDYFEKSGVPAELGEVVAEVSINSRRVSATAAADLDTHFMRMLGVDELPVAASSTAMESAQDIEILLVLDVSGSMVQGGTTRLANLRVAARDFVDTVLANDTENRVSIGIVPFNGQVNLGRALLTTFNEVDATAVPAFVGHSNCVDLADSAYDSLTLSLAAPLQVTAWADSFSLAGGLYDGNGDRWPDTVSSSFSDPNSNANRPVDTNRWCPNESGNTVLMPTRDTTALLDKIDALEGVGATSINAGMRWGLTLLDPASASFFPDFPGTLPQRPFPFERENTIKVIVLMTDGAHFAEERIRPGFRVGEAPIWRSAGDGQFSLLVDRPGTTADYWVPHRNGGAGEWRTAPWNSGSGVARLTWPQVWGGSSIGGTWRGVRVSWVAWQLYARSACQGAANTAACRRTAYISQMTAMRELTEPADMDTQLWDLCRLAIQSDIVVYGIAFEAPPVGRNAIRNCVTDRGRIAAGNYFDAQGLQIQTVFRRIAAQINALKLIQ